MTANPQTVVRFVIAAMEDGTWIGVFSPSIIGPQRVTAALGAAAAKIPGAKVEEANLAMPVLEDSGAAVTYTFGTVGAVRFPTRQPDAVILRAQRAVVDAFIEAGFEVST